MSATVIVSCDEFLGLARLYRVAVDGVGIGRLGFRSKVVRSDIGVGRHTVRVGYGSYASTERSITVDSDATVIRLRLVFDWRQAMRGAATGRRRRTRDGRPTLMTLEDDTRPLRR